jgi:hypothetical protein
MGFGPGLYEVGAYLRDKCKMMPLGDVRSGRPWLSLGRLAAKNWNMRSSKPTVQQAGPAYEISRGAV